MNALAFELPGLDHIRVHFLELLEGRKTSIARHALAAWDGETVQDITTNLERARSTLHQIAGTAGILGFSELGESARRCEAQIIAHLEGQYADLAICPGEIVWCIDAFVEACTAITAYAQARPTP